MELPVKLFLVVTEISEAFEEYRNGHDVREVYFTTDKDGLDKPEGIGTEVADAVIRILHFCDEFHIDLQALIEMKMAYNEKRPFRHGNKVV